MQSADHGEPAELTIVNPARSSRRARRADKRRPPLGSLDTKIAILAIVKRYRTRATAWLALLAVILAQLATAAYACPRIEDALQIPAAIATPATPCAEMGMAGPEAASTLCLEHCKVGQQLVDNHSPVVFVAAVAVVALFVPSPVADLSTPEGPVEPLLARATAPPVYASSSRLRI